MICFTVKITRNIFSWLNLLKLTVFTSHIKKEEMLIKGGQILVYSWKTGVSVSFQPLFHHLGPFQALCAFPTSLIPHSLLLSNLPFSLMISSCITASRSSLLFSDTCAMEESQTTTSCVSACVCERDKERGVWERGAQGDLIQENAPSLVCAPERA